MLEIINPVINSLLNMGFKALINNG